MSNSMLLNMSLCNVGRGVGVKDGFCLWDLSLGSIFILFSECFECPVRLGVCSDIAVVSEEKGIWDYCYK